MYLGHHELESKLIIVVIIVTIFINIIIIVIIVIIIIIIVIIIIMIHILIIIIIIIKLITDHRICWDAFEDPESGVASYSYQIFQLDSPTSPSASPAPSAPSSSSASTSASSASRKLLQTPSATPVTPQITLDASSARRAQLVTGLSLHYGSTYYAQITATNNADLNTTSSSTYVEVAKAPSNRSLLIAIVVLASIGVSMLLVACLTAFIVRRR